MCIKNQLTEKKRDEVLAGLPDIVPVWKVIEKSGRSRYSLCVSPKLTAHQIHKAENCPAYKMSINGRYRPGFHSYVTRKNAVACTEERHRIQKFYVRKSWITQIGVHTDFWTKIKTTVYVSSHITTKKSLLTEETT